MSGCELIIEIFVRTLTNIKIQTFHYNLCTSGMLLHESLLFYHLHMFHNMPRENMKHQRSSAFCQGTYKRCWRSNREAWRWWALCRAVCRCCPSIAAAGGRRSPGPRLRPCESTSLSLLLLARGQWSDMKGTSTMSSNSTTGLDLMRLVWSHIWNDNVKEDQVNLQNRFYISYTFQ